MACSFQTVYVSKSRLLYLPLLSPIPLVILGMHMKVFQVSPTKGFKSVVWLKPYAFYSSHWAVLRHTYALCGANSRFNPK